MNGCRLAATRSSAYPRPMLRALGAFLDRQIANAILARARRRWRPLLLVPAAWMRPVMKPVAVQIRRELARTAAWTMGTVGVIVVLLLLVDGW